MEEEDARTETRKMETDTEVGLRGYRDGDGRGNQEESGMGWGKLYFFLWEEPFICERESEKLGLTFFILGAVGNILEEAGKWEKIGIVYRPNFHI